MIIKKKWLENCYPMMEPAISWDKLERHQSALWKRCDVIKVRFLKGPSKSALNGSLQWLQNNDNQTHVRDAVWQSPGRRQTTVDNQIKVRKQAPRRHLHQVNKLPAKQYFNKKKVIKGQDNTTIHNDWLSQYKSISVISTLWTRSNRVTIVAKHDTPPPPAEPKGTNKFRL